MKDIKNRYTGEIILSVDSLRGANLIGLDLRLANLTGAYLADANLSRTNLADANLSRTNLARANLTRTNLARANLTGTCLCDANLADANLTGANLSRTNLSRTNLSRTNLARTNLTGAYLADANLAGANLAGANLTGANLRLATGNMREVRSMQADRWRVVWWMSGDTLMLAIGCEMYPAEQWWDFTDEQIDEMDGKALSWWRKWKAPLRLIVTELALATPAQRTPPDGH